MIRQEKIDKAIETLFDEIQFTSEPKGLYDPLRYMIAIGGKRLRPRLCLITYSLYRDKIKSEILEPAAGLEVFHSFTLIHDDIMDRSPLRRGVDTVWKKWDPDTAILSGDVMCIDSYARIAKAPKKSAAMNMIGLKTGVLIACAAKMGALIAGAPELDCDSLYGYGYNLGLAFQVADDYLDAYGDEKVFGKPIGGDIVNSKKSWLTIRALEKADEAQNATLLQAMEMPAGSAEEKAAKIAKVKGLYDELSVAEDAKQTILALNEKALETASRVCSGVRYERLRRFADKLVGRTK